jgi:hypothetical protein
VKADTRRIPNRHNNNEEEEIDQIVDEVVPEPEPMPEPVIEAVVVEPELEPEPVAQFVEEEITEFEPVVAPIPRQLDEVEYTWHDAPTNGKPSKNGHHAAETPLRLQPWPAAPMIHRPDWW